MNKFTTGLLAGGIIGAMGLGYAMTDKRTRKRLSKDSHRMMKKANQMMNRIEDMM